MNPWALVILGIGVLLVIIGVKGSYGNVVGALTGKPYTGGKPPVAPPNPFPGVTPGILGPHGRLPL